MLMDRETYKNELEYEIKKIDYKIAEFEEMIEQHFGTSKTKDEINSLVKLRDQKKIELILFK